MHVCELLSQLKTPQFLVRTAVDTPQNVIKTRKYIKQAFQNQIDGKGFSLVEVVSSCPTNWGMTPKQALDWIESDMLPYYPLGVYKDRSAEKKEAE